MLRITSGEYRNRRIEIPDTDQLRPMLEKPRMALFSILGQDFAVGERVLDCFAGSGVLGLEALSRGASHAVFYDTHPVHVEALRKLVATLGCGARCTIHRADVMHMLRPKGSVTERPRGEAAPFRLIFVDPPHAMSKDMGGEFYEWFADFSHHADVDGRSVTIFGHAAETVSPQECGLWRRFDTRVYGSVAISLFERGDLAPKCRTLYEGKL